MTSWRNCEEHLRRYHPEDIQLKEIDTAWVRGFREYLDTCARQWDIDGRKRNVEPQPISLETKGLIKNFRSETPCSSARNPLSFEFSDSAEAFVERFRK